MTDKKYSTIQVSKDMVVTIREFCKKNGLVASTITENYWRSYISSSMSGSIFV